jgi:hypothetical protein
VEVFSSEGPNYLVYIVNFATAEQQPSSELHFGDELSDDQRENLRKMVFDDFPELIQPADSPHVSRPRDHPIDITGPMWRRRLNRMSHTKREELNGLVNDVVLARVIRTSCSEFGSPILFVRKADGSLRFCINYRGLNEVTRKDAYPLPRVDDTLDELKDAIFYMHLNLASGLWQVRVRENDVHETAFPTLDGLMEWVAMLFRLCNVALTFLQIMKDNLRNFLHKFVIVYLDDVCIYNRNLEERMEHLRLILQRLN